MSIDGSSPPPQFLIDRLFVWLGQFGERTSPIPILAFLIAGMLFSQLSREIHDTDIFWQLKLGEITLDQGLPKHEPFIAGKEQEPLAVVAWLAQVIYAGVRHLGGWHLLWLFDALIWFAGFVVVAMSCAREARNVWPVALGLWVGWFGALPTASVRPQSFSALAFGLLIVLMRSNLSLSRTLLSGMILFVLWQNLHPSVVLGGIVLASACFAESIQYLRKKRDTLPWRMIALLPVAAVSTIATPAGLDIFRISQLNAELSLYLQVPEWLPVYVTPREFGRPFALSMLFVTFMTLCLKYQNVRAQTFAIVLVLSAATISSHRFVLFWGISVIPLWFEMLGTPAEMQSNRSRIRRPLAILALFVGIAIPCCRAPAPFASYYPFDGVKKLREANIKGTIFSTNYWSGVLIDAGYPEWRVTHDGRYYLFATTEWDRYFEMTNREPGVSIDEIVARYQPAAFFLRPGSDDVLIAKMNQHHDWSTLYSGTNCIVYVPARNP